MNERNLNCWEYMRCGREPDGVHAGKEGVCPAAVDAGSDGVNGGRYAGRCCWLISGTLCHGAVQGKFAKKLSTCFSCDFYQLVLKQEAGLTY